MDKNLLAEYLKDTGSNFYPDFTVSGVEVVNDCVNYVEHSGGDRHVGTPIPLWEVMQWMFQQGSK